MVYYAPVYWVYHAVYHMVYMPQYTQYTMPQYELILGCPSISIYCMVYILANIAPVCWGMGEYTGYTQHRYTGAWYISRMPQYTGACNILGILGHGIPCHHILGVYWGMVYTLVIPVGICNILLCV